MSELFKDANGNEVEISKDDFTLVQQDKKIFDKKFDTKPTTFFKDALKRFAKNKSSVVAAIIIGILVLLSIFVPIFNTHDISGARPYERLMSPKLFNFGGNNSSTFWTGTKHYSDLVYDAVNHKIGGDFVDDYAYNVVLTKEGDNYTDTAHKYAYGGTLVVAAKKVMSPTADPAKNTLKIYTGAAIETLKSTDGLKLTYTMNDKYGSYEEFALSEYRVVLMYGDTKNPQYLTVKDYSTEYTSNTLDLSAALSNNSLSEISNVKVMFEAKAYTDKLAYMAFKSVELSATDTALNEVVSKKGFTDANAQCLTKSTDSNYWTSNGKLNVRDANIIKVSFDYDEYQNVFGLQEHKISGQEMENYIRNGWCTYDFTTKKFVKLSDKCPIEEVISQQNVGSSSYELTCKVTMYKYYGYSSMPKFVFGTDAQGRDIFKYAFFALQTSFLIALIVTAINFTIGLIYGSIEGYFGGNVDLIMERITDILAYIPFTVLITLIFLNMGRTLFVFGLGLCLTGWIGVAGRTRTQFYRFKGREYVLASRTLGASDARLIFKHILPNALGTLITTSILMVPATVVSESALAYLGLGLQGTASFGVVLSDNQQYLSTHPALILFPAVIISLLMISFNLFGNGLRDAFNPSLKGSE